MSRRMPRLVIDSHMRPSPAALEKPSARGFESTTRYWESTDPPSRLKGRLATGATALFPLNRWQRRLAAPAPDREQLGLVVRVRRSLHVGGHHAGASDEVGAGETAPVDRVQQLRRDRVV